MKYLTFLDYSTLETTGKNIESKLLEKDKEIGLLKRHESINADAISTLSDQLSKLHGRSPRTKGRPKIALARIGILFVLYMLQRYQDSLECFKYVWNNIPDETRERLRADIISIMGLWLTMN